MTRAAAFGNALPKGNGHKSVRKEKDMKKAVKKIIDALVFLFGIGGKIRDDAVDDGSCNFSGQGRDKYGR